MRKIIKTVKVSADKAIPKTDGFFFRVPGGIKMYTNQKEKEKD